MTSYSGFVAEMYRLQAMLGRRARDIEEHAATVTTVLSNHGHTATAHSVHHQLLDVGEWLRTWDASLDHRSGVLSGEAAVATASLRRTGTAPPVPPGERTAADLIDALQQGDLSRTARLLDTLDASAPEELARFFSAFGADMVALLPLLVFEQGVPAAALDRYIRPLAVALAAVLPTGQVPFGIEDVMHDAARSEIGPGAYFAFADFADADLVTASVQLVGEFHRRELPLRTPPYRLPGGGRAHPDPRTDLLRRLLDHDIPTRAAFVEAVVESHGAAALVDPTTAWGDGGEAVAAVLASVAGGLEREVVLAVAVAVAGAPEAAPAVRLAAWRLLWVSILTPLIGA